MSTFKVGNTTIGDSPLINDEVKKQLHQEELFVIRLDKLEEM